jgi:hypothetical protein
MKLNEFITESTDGPNKVDKALWDFLATNDNPPDDKVHSFAEKLHMEPDDLETKIYKLFTSFTTKGKSKGKVLDVDAKELDMGKIVEMEHTTDKRIAEKIARDHLVEIPDYYTRLAAMEAQAEKEGMKH